MKKTFLAMLMAGGSMVMYAQVPPTTKPTPPTTTPTSPTTAPTNPTTSPTNPTTSPTTPTTSPTNPTTPPTTTSPTDPTDTIINPNANNNNTNPNMNNNAINNNNTWNNGNPPTWGWTSYGIWDNNNAMSGKNMNATDSMNSTGTYNASAPVSNVTIPYSVNTNYGKEYPMAAASNGTWSQYGDWFYTTYMTPGRYSQIFYDQRGNGYSVALPVLNTFVPENVVNMALQRYGSNLYSITMLKSAEGKDAYQINLLDRGQTKMEWVGDDGATAMNIYRTEEMEMATDSLNTMDANAAKDSMNNISPTDINKMPSEAEMKASDEKEIKTKWKDGDMKTKVKAGDGKVKIKQKKADD